MLPNDTIAAVSSATGPAARMIVRLSGPEARRIAAQLAPDLPPGPNAIARLRLGFDGLRVPACCFVFRAPRSYTGEDLVELHVPGNPVLARMLLADLLRRGARPAEAGEFTARAYFNGRLDLAEAEGVAATISAGNDAELSAARQLLAGELARRLRPAMDAVAETLALVEVGIDFSDEDVSFLSGDEVGRRVGAAGAALRGLLADSSRFERLAHEPHLVLVGRPNAGKSTLLNALAGRARAVTSPAAGTTRDALTAELHLPRGTVRLTDVAGLEDADLSHTGEDDAAQSTLRSGGTAPPGPAAPLAPIERQMRERALRALESADAAVLVHDATDPRPPLRLPRPSGLSVLSKSDLPAAADPLCDRPGERREWHEHRGPGDEPARSALLVSALTGDGLDALRHALDRLAFGAPVSGSALALNARHVRAIDSALEALGRATRLADQGAPELLALELREALDALGQVLGRVSPDDLLGRIFSSFCIGK